jgi:alkyl hydroperoxide reductase subunit AhpC
MWLGEADMLVFSLKCISLISNFPDFTAVCDVHVAVAIPLYSYIDSIRNLFVIMSSSDNIISIFRIIEWANYVIRNESCNYR